MCLNFDINFSFIRKFFNLSDTQNTATNSTENNLANKFLFFFTPQINSNPNATRTNTQRPHSYMQQNTISTNTQQAILNTTINYSFYHQTRNGITELQFVFYILSECYRRILAFHGNVCTNNRVVINKYTIHTTVAVSERHRCIAKKNISLRINADNDSWGMERKNDVSQWNIKINSPNSAQCRAIFYGY